MMKNKLTLLAALLLAGSLTLTACGDSETGAGSPENSADFNDADVTFAQAMIPHHQQAVAMAELADAQASSPEVKQLAAEIEAAQGPEIETMTSWLEEWGAEVPDSADGMDHGSMDGMEGMDLEDMPGMMTDQQMSDLDEATGATFDRLFLTMMIAHHQGAVEMAETEISDGQNADAVALAEQIEATQTEEIATMQELLGQ